MHKYSVSRLFVAGVAFVLSVAAHADVSPTLGKSIDALIDQTIADGRLTGAVVLVAHDGKIVYQRAAGVADREANKPMQVDALFRLSSVSKPIVTAAAMVLIDQKKLSLDDPVTKWLPEFKPKLADGTTPTITVRNLLTHTAGIGYKFAEKAGGPYAQAGISDGFDDVKVSLAENVKRIASLPLLNPPGNQFRYSLSIDVLGAVVEKAAGQPLDEAVAKLVTEPLAMKDTSFWVDASKAARVATPYYNTPSGPAKMEEGQKIQLGAGTLVYSPARAFDKNAYPSGGAGMIGTAPDLMRLLEAIRKGGAPIVSQATASAMMSNQVGAASGQQPGVRFGFGGAVISDPVAAKSPLSAGSWYWSGVYGLTWFVDPGRQVTVVAFTNTALEGMSGKFPGALRNVVSENVH